MSRRASPQLALRTRRPHRDAGGSLTGWGGPRPGAGRPRSGRAGVPHLPRARLAARHPVHVTLRVVSGVGDLREKKRAAVVREAFVGAAAAARVDFRVVHFSIMSNHLHLIVEAHDRDALARGVKGLEVRIARRLNALLVRKGAVFADRYHARALKTPRETRNALRYVLLNGAKHARAAARVLDPLSSGAYFDGWRSPPPGPSTLDDPPPVEDSHTWLLRVGWRRHGLLSFSEVPAA